MRLRHAMVLAVVSETHIDVPLKDHNKCFALCLSLFSPHGFGVFHIGGARPQTRVLIDYIRTHQSWFRVEPICDVLNEHGIQIAPSTHSAYVARDFGRLNGIAVGPSG